MRIATLVSSLLLVGTAAAQIDSAVPARLQNIEGASWHFKPFQDSNMHFQHVFSNGELPAALKTGGKVVTGVGFRNEGRFVGTFAARIIQNVTVTIGHAPAGVDGVNCTTTFANNLDTATAGYTKTIFQGNLNVAAHTSGQTNTIGTPVMIVQNQGPWVVQATDRAFTIDIVANDANNTNTVTTYNCDRMFGSTNHLVSFIGGSSCPAGKNSLTIGTTNVQPGGTMDVRGTNCSIVTGAAINWIGLDVVGVSLAPAFGAGCLFMTTPLIMIGAPVIGSAMPSTTTFNQWPIPNDPGLVGTVVNSQYAVLDAAATGGLGFSLAAQFAIGDPVKKGRIDGTYLYFTGAGDVSTITTANSGPWRNRCDVAVVRHN